MENVIAMLDQQIAELQAGVALHEAAAKQVKDQIKAIEKAKKSLQPKPVPTEDVEPPVQPE